MYWLPRVIIHEVAQSTTLCARVNPQHSHKPWVTDFHSSNQRLHSTLRWPFSVLHSDTAGSPTRHLRAHPGCGGRRHWRSYTVSHIAQSSTDAVAISMDRKPTFQWAVGVLQRLDKKVFLVGCRWCGCSRGRLRGSRFHGRVA